MAEYFFTRNAIRLEVPVSAGKPTELSVQLWNPIAIGLDKYSTKYTAHISRDAVLDLGEILDAIVPDLPDAELSKKSDSVLLHIENASAAGPRWFRVLTQSSSSPLLSGNAFRGGVSRQNFLAYAAANTDVFEARLFRMDRNFFWTGRTVGRIIAMKETELEPLIFYKKDLSSATLKITAGEHSFSFGISTSGVWALDVEELRRKFYEEFNIIANLFTIAVNGKQACTLVIEEAPVARERAIIRFRNSLGAFERIDLPGEVSVKLTHGEDESANFLSFEPQTMRFVNGRNRPTTSQTYELSTLLQAADVPLFVQMLAAEEAWLISADGSRCRVIPSVEELTFGARFKEPQPVTLSLRCIFDDLNPTADIAEVIGTRSRLFHHTFDNYFN